MSLANSAHCQDSDGDTLNADQALAKLHELLKTPRADSDIEREMTDLVGRLAELKHGPAKEAVYATVFYWFGFDDTMTANPKLFALKEKLEKQINAQVVEAAGNLKNVKSTSLVFLQNRKELAKEPAAKPEFRALVQVSTTTRVNRSSTESNTREAIARRMKIPATDIGLRHGIKNGTTFVNNTDERLGTQPAHFLMWKVCEFLENDHNPNDDTFLKWAVANKKLKRGLASEIIPELFKPEKRPDFKVHIRDAQFLATKIIKHFGVKKIKEMTEQVPSKLQSLIESGVLNKQDATKVALHKFERFGVKSDVAFSRRYEFALYYVQDGDMHITTVTVNHLGVEVDPDEETDKSTDLAADVKTMWSVDDKGRSPQSAIEAASRVFFTFDPVVKTRDEIVKTIGDYSSRPKGVYNAPFWPLERGQQSYRFDTGNYGWQFNLTFDKKGLCTKAERKWIH
ncbi:hypothetical protein N9Y42_08675 [Mariniblastus sp.]|nr:hypothetical protein [Mariniblastus sp.]